MGGLFGSTQNTTQSSKTVNTSTTTVPVNITENITNGISPAAEGALMTAASGTSFISQIGQTVGTTASGASSAIASNPDLIYIILGLAFVGFLIWVIAK